VRTWTRRTPRPKKEQKSETGDEETQTPKLEPASTGKTRRFKLTDHKGPLACDICKQECSTKSSLTRHRLRHFPDAKRFKCASCDRMFFEKKDMIDHVKTHLTKKDKCGYCHKLVRDVDLHYRNCSKFLASRSILKCHLCLGIFSSEEELKKHIPDCDAPSYQCDYCDMRFPNMSKLSLHLKRHNPLENKIKCEECNIFFKNERSFNAHMKQHKPLEKCKYCGVMCPGGFHLVKDCKVKFMKNATFTCPYCNLKITGSHTHIIRHITRKHGEAEAVKFEECLISQKTGTAQTCTVCGFYFTGSQTLLRRHMETHHGVGEGTLKCEVCGEMMPIAAYPDHLQTHHTDTTHVVYECNDCGCQFGSKEEVEGHSQVCVLQNESQDGSVCYIITSAEDTMDTPEAPEAATGHTEPVEGATVFMNYEG